MTNELRNALIVGAAIFGVLILLCWRNRCLTETTNVTLRVSDDEDDIGGQEIPTDTGDRQNLENDTIPSPQNPAPTGDLP